MNPLTIHPDISAVVTFHREGRLARVSLNSIARTRDVVEQSGRKVEIICMLDCPDEETIRMVCECPHLRESDRKIEVSYADLSASRNEAVLLSNASSIAIFDGDDLYSANWLERVSALDASDNGRRIYHPEITVSFDALQGYNFTVDQRDPVYDRHNLLMANYWCSSCYASREVFIEHPYMLNDRADGGFGFEDWHWNCETVAAGYEHRIVPGTALFYRRKRYGSMNAANFQAHRVIWPSRLFSILPKNKAAR